MFASDDLKAKILDIRDIDVTIMEKETIRVYGPMWFRRVLGFRQEWGNEWIILKSGDDVRVEYFDVDLDSQL
jgi:hypothetical protein